MGFLGRLFFDLQSGRSGPQGRHHVCGPSSSGGTDCGSEIQDETNPPPRLFVVHRNGSGFEILAPATVAALQHRVDGADFKVGTCIHEAMAHVHSRDLAHMRFDGLATCMHGTS